MRHKKHNKKFGRSMSHRSALVSSLVCALIKEERIRTTLPKAKEARREAEKMVTLGRKQAISAERAVGARRLAVARLRQRDAVKKLFDDIVPRMDGRPGGYTRITKLGQRRSDGSEMAILEWVSEPLEAKERAPAPVVEEKVEDSPAPATEEADAAEEASEAEELAEKSE